MSYHTKIVRRGAVRAMVVCDMPFLTYQVSAHEAIRNCGRVMQETDCHGVKLEGGAAMAETVRALVDVGIPDVHERPHRDRKSTRLNSSHGYISYAVFCLKKKNEY